MGVTTSPAVSSLGGAIFVVTLPYCLRIIRERVRSGMANAKAKGAKIGRPQATADDIPANFLRHYPAFQKKQLNVSELARVCDLSRTTVYKYIGLLEQ